MLSTHFTRPRTSLQRLLHQTQRAYHRPSNHRPHPTISDSWFTARRPPKSFTSRNPAPQPLTDLFFRRTYSQGGFPAGSSNSALRATYLLITLNLVVFAGWQYATATGNRKLTQTMHDNFTLSWRNLKEGRAWTVVTSAFSHVGLGHIFFNMFALRTFGTLISCVPGVGAAHMLFLSLGSGIAGSVAWLGQKASSTPVKQSGWFGSTTQRGGRVSEVALGASGLVMGAGAVAACLMPFAPMSLMFIPIPIPLWAITALYAAVDTYFLKSETSRIGHSAHLGGALFGMVYYFGFLRKYGGIWKMMTMRRR
ncbi:hypothetical protein LTR62_002615 [Meristemomyces frigidus]|uniref:Peptidase S54 rhomboid domain-containing protein n=1 Tax=Meristemomyces frigidus TaxID=1508187 RepID=A0AAN7YHG7_9PEZI|nr:hypothetical protein LTR62_002615 [Meristemomyces frigidus]